MPTGGELILKRQPGTPRPTREQAQSAWQGVSELRHTTDHPLIRGAYMAAEWTMELTDSRPISTTDLDPRDLIVSVACGDGKWVTQATEHAVNEEILYAIEVLQKKRKGDESLAMGVYAWLAWWVGYEDMPTYFVTGTEEFDNYMAAYADR